MALTELSLPLSSRSINIVLPTMNDSHSTSIESVSAAVDTEVWKKVLKDFPHIPVSQAARDAVVKQNIDSGWLSQPVTKPINFLVTEIKEFYKEIEKAIQDSGEPDGSIHDLALVKLLSEAGDVANFSIVVRHYLEKDISNARYIPQGLFEEVEAVFNISRDLGFRSPDDDSDDAPFSLDDAVMLKVERNYKKYAGLFKQRLSSDEIERVRMKARDDWGEEQDLPFEMAKMILSGGWEPAEEEPTAIHAGEDDLVARRMSIVLATIAFSQDKRAYHAPISPILLAALARKARQDMAPEENAILRNTDVFGELHIEQRNLHKENHGESTI